MDEKAESLLRRAETILRQRTDRVVLVLERVLDNTNYLGCLRTAEILGIQNVWVVQLPRGHAKEEREKQLQRERSKQGQLNAAQAQQGQQPGSQGGRKRGGKRRHTSEAGSDADPQPPHDSIDTPAGDSAQQLANDTTSMDADQHQSHSSQQGPTVTAPPGSSQHPSSAPEHSEGGGDGIDQDGCMDGEADGEAERAAEGPSGGVEGLSAELVGTENGQVEEERLRQEIRRRLRFSRASSQWLDVRFFWSIESCIQELKSQGWTIWATDLSRASVSLPDDPSLDPLPDKVAIVMGREADGVSKQMLAAADRRVFLPMFGFNASLNVMVATGMVLQCLLQRWPQLRGAMTDTRRQELRHDWYGKLARNEAQKAEFLAKASDPPEPYDITQLKNILAAHDQ